MQLGDFIDNFEEYPLWKKILLFVPLIIVGIAILFLSQRDSEFVINEVVDDSKKNADKKLKSFEKELKKSEGELEKLEEERKKIEREIEDEKADYRSTIDRIDNADVDELSSIAAELRSRAKSRRDK